LKKINFILFLLIIAFSMPAYATLHNRGGGLIYDDILNITWLQDANYAKTSDYDSDGMMNWNESVNWANGLVYYDSLRNVYWDDWRLPSVMNIDGSTPIEGYIQSGSEMGHLFYVDLNNVGWKPISNTFPFFNIQADYYWNRELGPLDGCAWYLNFGLGYQNGRLITGNSYAWAVRDGDVGSIPEPNIMLLLGLGLIGLAGIRRKMKSITL